MTSLVVKLPLSGIGNGGAWKYFPPEFWTYNSFHAYLYRSFIASGKRGNRTNVFTNPALAKTLRILAKAGSAAPFYGGVLSQTIIEDIQKNKGTMTLSDLKNYRAILREPVEMQLDDKRLYSAPPPAGGMILSLILNVLKGRLTFDNIISYKPILHNNDT